MTKKFFSMVLAAGILMTLTVPPVRADENDDRIEAAAKESYVFKTHLKDDQINVDSEEGVVTLTGNVANVNHKSLAESTVENLPGVTSVNNQLQVKDPATADNSDAWLGVKVKTALLFRRNVSALGTKVSVADGIVTLEGEADTQAQKDLTAQYVNDVEGVKGVNNKLTVVPREMQAESSIKEKIDDASITAQAKMALLFNRSTSALKTNVDTDNGVVTLTGMAKTAAEKDLVSKLVAEINGVVNVVNNIDVETP